MCEPFGRVRRDEVDIVDGVFAVAIDEIEKAAADPFDSGNVELHGAELAGDGLRPARERMLVSFPCIADAQSDGADGGPVKPREGLGEAFGFGIDDEVHVALPIERHRLRAMAGDGAKAHPFEERAQRRRIRCRVLDELESVRARRIVPRARFCVSVHIPSPGD